MAAALQYADGSGGALGTGAAIVGAGARARAPPQQSIAINTEAVFIMDCPPSPAYRSHGRLSRLLAQLAHNASRIADCQTICGDILGYHATGTDSGVVADG